MSQREPDRRTILLEIFMYALLFVLVGALFAGFRAVREGPRVLDYDVRGDER